MMMARGINRRGLAFLCCLAGCAAAPAVPEPRPIARETPDQAVQRVLAKHGLSARIVRPWIAVKDAPASGQNVSVLLEGSPSVEVGLDRDYWILAVTKTGEPFRASWVLTPKDEQSGLNIV